MMSDLDGTLALQEEVLQDTGMVEVVVRSDGKVLWVNADGCCILRVLNISNLSIIDNRAPSNK